MPMFQDLLVDVVFLLTRSCRFQAGKNALQKSSTLQNKTSKLYIEDLFGFQLMFVDNKSLLPFGDPPLSRIHVNLRIYVDDQVTDA